MERAGLAPQLSGGTLSPKSPGLSQHPSYMGEGRFPKGRRAASERGVDHRQPEMIPVPRRHLGPDHSEPGEPQLPSRSTGGGHRGHGRSLWKTQLSGLLTPTEMLQRCTRGVNSLHNEYLSLSR